MEITRPLAHPSALLPSPTPTAAATVDIVVPVFNEAAELEASIRRLHGYLEDRFPLTWTITIADNASTDETWAIACRMASDLPMVHALHLDQRGRGRALRTAWAASASPVVAYMDVDLSTDLDALLPLVAPLLSGHSDVAIGTRLAPGARVARGAKREVISRTYNLLLRTSLRSGFSDAQCGFKALRADVARALVPEVEDQGWFFDTELLVLAERSGLRIHEVPVDWTDDPVSTVDLVRTARGDLLGVARMLRSRPLLWAGRPDLAAPRSPAPATVADQLARFASIGVVSTLVFGVLLSLLSGPLGWALGDLVALTACSIANTAANRRLTFEVRGARRPRRQLRDGVLLAVLPMVMTLSAIALTPGVAAAARIAVVALAGGASALIRFGLMRGWVFR